MFAYFLDVIYGVSLRGIGEDKICWMLAKSRGFEVSRYYQALMGIFIHSFPWSIRSKVVFFVWIAAL